MTVTCAALFVGLRRRLVERIEDDIIRYVLVAGPGFGERDDCAAQIYIATRSGSLAAKERCVGVFNAADS